MTIDIQGVDANSGLALCDGDLNIYRNALRLYITNIPPALDKMRNVTEAELKDYTVSVHGVKSTSEIIGAEEARKTAKDLEALAKAGDLTGILAKNDDFIKYVEGIISGIQNWLKENDASGA